MSTLSRVVLFALFVQASPVMAKPNVVLIVADDLGWADLGCYGSTFHKTPHLDRMALAGMKFSEAYAACPVCSPTRAAMLTGKHPARLQITDWIPGRPNRPEQIVNRSAFRNELPLNEITLAEAFKTAGYATAHIGKWHLGGDGFGPKEQGFDINIAGDHTGTPLSYFAPFQNKGRFMPGLEKAEAGEYLTDRLTSEAETFLRANAQKPFFLYLPHYGVHTPMRAKAEWVKKYADKPAFGKQSNAVYAAMLESLDDSVGRVRKLLDELKIRDNTIVIFTSDNGGLATLEGQANPPTFNGPLREGKGYLYEGGIRVPLLAVGPGIKPGSSSVPVTSQDFFPTLCELCDIPLSAKLDGVNIVPLLHGGDAPKRDALYWHYPHYANQGSRPGGAIRDGQYKLIEYYERNRRELFDLKSDFRESQNLIEAKPEIAKALTAKLAAWRIEVGAQMPVPNPNYLPNPQATDGTIPLPARFAEVHGVMLRYEPLPHKNTLGFWVNKDDFATWEFTVTKPGTFSVEIMQGCGTGNGGSEVNVSVGEQTLSFTVIETGGFQNFKPRDIGTLKLEKAGRYTLTVKPKTKAKAAVMDVRLITLKPS